jgi:hypothetical protein
MSQRLKLGAKSEIENMCIAFWCLTAVSDVTVNDDICASPRLLINSLTPKSPWY